MLDALAIFARFVVKQGCIDCDRICPRCRYDIRGGWEHIEQPQPAGGSHVVCKLARATRPMVERITGYFDHMEKHMVTVTVKVPI